MSFHELTNHADQIRKLSEYVDQDNATAINAIVGFIDNLTEEGFNHIKNHQSGSRAIWWAPEDFINRRKENNEWYKSHQMHYKVQPEPTYEEASDMLEDMIENHDCNLGITWDTVDVYLSRE